MVTVEGAQHVVREVNPAFCRLIESTKEQLVGKPIHELLPSNDDFMTLLDRVYRTGKPETHTEQQNLKLHPDFWSYAMWPLMAEERPSLGWWPFTMFDDHHLD